MSEMVERVARAMVEVEDLTPDWQLRFRGMARRAIQAMREPTEAMASAAEADADANGHMVSRGYTAREDLVAGYQAMVEEALR